MNSARSLIISLGNELSEQQNRAFELWTWLPSHKAAKDAHGDYADEFTPSVSDVITEAAFYLSHGMNPTEEQKVQAGDFYRCPCGDLHED